MYFSKAIVWGYTVLLSSSWLLCQYIIVPTVSCNAAPNFWVTSSCSMWQWGWQAECYRWASRLLFLLASLEEQNHLCLQKFCRSTFTNIRYSFSNFWDMHCSVITFLYNHNLIRKWNGREKGSLYINTHTDV